jgi:hypothetical protein
MVQRTPDWKQNFMLITGELHECVQWMREAADTGDQGRLRAEIRYAVKLLGKATDQVVILAKAKKDDEVAARELPTSPAENEENFYT